MFSPIERDEREVGIEDAERRVLPLTHPALDGRVVTTANLSNGLQILEPGERAAARRHRSGRQALSPVRKRSDSDAHADLARACDRRQGAHGLVQRPRPVICPASGLCFLQLGRESKPADDLSQVRMMCSSAAGRCRQATCLKRAIRSCSVMPGRELLSRMGYLLEERR
jgi:hypothetical protein